MKKILTIALTVLLVTGAVFLLAFTDQQHQSKSYKSIQVEIINPSDDAMITADEISEIIRENFGEIKGTLMTRVDLDRIESMIRNNPYVSSCEVYQMLGGELTLKARVRKPLVRVINEDLKQYHIDYTGCLMPVSTSHPAHILVANGRIPDSYVSLSKSEISLSSYPDSSILRQIYPVALHIVEDEFLKSFIEQIYVNDNGEMELVPKIGTQNIILGDATHAAKKLQNLKTFYREVMSKTDWSLYKTINLKYKNQVVCAKSEQK